MEQIQIKNTKYQMKSNEIFLDKKSSNIIKGTAIILMIIHHFWGFNHWVIESNNYSYILKDHPGMEYIIGGFGKICVAMYAFITGYAVQINKNKYSSLKYRIKIIVRFLLNYWIFAFGFIIIGFLINENLPDINHFIANLFGLYTGVFEYGSGYICVTMAWYVSFYVSIMIILPIILIHTHKGFIIDTFLMSSIFAILIYIFNNTSINSIPIIGGILNSILIYAKVVLIGYYIGEYRVFDMLNNLFRLNSLLKIVSGIIICILIFILRVKIPQIHLEYIYVTFFIFAIILIYKECCKYKIFNSIEKIILMISTESLNIWFIHSIFFTPERKLQFIAYWPKNSILIIIWTLLILFPICRMITKLQDKIWNKISKSIKWID